MPDCLVGELSRFVCRSGSKGIDRIVADFTAIHPEASKRQVEKKIQASCVYTVELSYHVNSNTISHDTMILLRYVFGVIVPPLLSWCLSSSCGAVTFWGVMFLCPLLAYDYCLF